MSALPPKADICGATADVRFTLNSDRESGFPQKAMSALPPKADMCSALADVRFVPIADIARSFDHFVGAGEQCRGNRYPERPRCTHIDD